MSKVIVESGDSLWKIANKAGITVDQLIELNSNQYPSLLENKALIHPGWELRLNSEETHTQEQLVEAVRVSTPSPPQTKAANKQEAQLKALLADVKALPPKDRKTIQRMLVRAGYNTNGIDGIIGPASTKALGQWMTDNPDLQNLTAQALVSKTNEILITEASDFETQHRNTQLPEVLSDFQNAAQIKLAPDVSNDAIAREIQTDLKTLGFYKLRIDGDFGPGSIKALKDWQQKNKLTPTGELTVDQAVKIKEQAEAKRAETNQDYSNVDQSILSAAWDRVEGKANSTTTPAFLLEKPLVVIDLGHGTLNNKGTWDPGAVSAHNGLRETDIIDSVGAALAKILVARGYDVAFTRGPGEIFKYKYNEKVGPDGLSSREVRAAFAAELSEGRNNTYLISLHANSDKPGARGAEVYTASASATDNDEQLNFGRAPLDNQSAALTRKIAESLGPLMGNKARTGTADFGALVKAEEVQDTPLRNIHTALIELGYLSDWDDAARLADMARNPDKAAKAIADAVTSFHNKTYGLEQTNTTTYKPKDTSRWTMTAQMTGSETSPEGNVVSLGILTLKAPNGITHEFDFKSGGFGRYGDESMLPGLSSDLVSAWDNVNAAYPIDWRSFVANTRNIRHDMSGETGIGSWLRLGSDRAQTRRGAVIGKDSSGFFGIHTDGPSGPGGHHDDGSKGCITLADEASQKLFAMLENIPASQRPTELIVLPQAVETRLAHTTDLQPRPT